jgi:hypothetical protein
MIKTSARYSDAPSHQTRYVHIVIASCNLQTSRAWASQASIQTAGVPAVAVLDIAGRAVEYSQHLRSRCCGK